MVQRPELLSKPSQSPPPVLKLASLGTTLATHAGRAVDQTHAGIGGVLVLAALTTGPEGLNPAFGKEIPIAFGNRDRRRRGWLISHGTSYARFRAEDVW